MSYVANPACVEMAVEPTHPATAYSTRPTDFTHKTHNFGGAGLSGSPSSYLRILRALLCGGILDGNRILKPETVDMMFQSQLDTDVQKNDVAAFTQGFLEPFSRRNGAAFPGVSWGLGGALSGKGIPSGRSDGCLTWFGFANTYWVIDKAQDVAFGECDFDTPYHQKTDFWLPVLFTNIVPARSAKMFELWHQVEPEIFSGLKELKFSE